MTVSDAQTRIYLDVCTLCRPYDDQNLMRIRLETDAFYLILQHVQNGRYTMIVSPVQFREVAAIEETRERAEVTALLHRYSTSTAQRKFLSDLSDQRTSRIGPFERFGHGLVEILNKGENSLAELCHRGETPPFE